MVQRNRDKSRARGSFSIDESGTPCDAGEDGAKNAADAPIDANPTQFDSDDHFAYNPLNYNRATPDGDFENAGEPSVDFDTDAINDDAINDDAINDGVINDGAINDDAEIGDRATAEAGLVLDGKYRLTGIAGSGAMGEVWRAVDLVTNAPVAIKFIRPRKNYKKVVELFYKSYLRVHDLHHEYICPLYHMNNSPTLGYYLVMQWMPDSLKRYCKTLQDSGRAISVDEIRRIASMIGEALDYAHSKGVIHRDVKPGNIAIQRDKNGVIEKAFLIDFDLCRFAEADGSADRVHSGVSGTPVYMAPEQWLNSDQDRKTDQYSLAVLVYELLAGYPPYFSTVNRELKEKVLRNSFPSIPRIPAYVNTALRRAMLRNPAHRFKTCSEFARALNPPNVFKWRCVSLSAAGVLLVIFAAAFFGFSGFPWRSQASVEPVPVRKSVEIVLARQNERLAYRMTLPAALEPRSALIRRPPPEPGEGATLTVDGKRVEPGKNASGKGWTYTCDPKASAGTLRLDGYHGGEIAASSVRLAIVLARSSRNVVKAYPGLSGIVVRDGSLTIKGEGERPTGSLDVFCFAGNTHDGDPDVAAIFVCGKKCGLALERIAALTVSAEGIANGVLVENGTLVFRNVVKAVIACNTSRDAVHVLGDCTMIAGKSDEYDFTGGVRCDGAFACCDETAPNVARTVPPARVRYNGYTINAFVSTAKELARALRANDRHDEKSPPYVVAVTNDMLSERGIGKTKTDFAFATGRGDCVLLPFGDHSIKRCPEHDPEQPLLYVSGALTVGAPNPIGSCRLMFDGGGVRKPLPPDADVGAVQEDGRQTTCKFTTLDKKVFELTKYAAERTSRTALVHVAGTMTLGHGAVVANNLNLRDAIDFAYTTRERADFAGGVYVESRGNLVMNGGDISYCQAISGGGVSVDGRFQFEDGVIHHNVVVNRNGFEAVQGGAVMVCEGTFDMSGGQIVNNAALSIGFPTNEHGNAKGAGIHCGGLAQARITGGLVARNLCMWAGGGIYVGGNGSAFVRIAEDALVMNNVAECGGAIYMNAPVDFAGGRIVDNTLFQPGNAFVCAGEGVFMRNENFAMAKRCVLYLRDDAFFGKNDSIYIWANELFPAANKYGDLYFPIVVPGNLTDPERQRFHLNANRLGFATSRTAPMVELAGIDTAHKNELRETDALFSFGYLGAPENTRFKLVTGFYKTRNRTTNEVERHGYIGLRPN